VRVNPTVGVQPDLVHIKEDRCLQTAAPTSRALGIPIFVEHGDLPIMAYYTPSDNNICPGIGEWYSPVVPGSGLHPRPGSAESLHGFFPEVATDGWKTVFYPPMKGETPEEVHARASTTLSAVFTQLDRTMPQDNIRVLMFTHAATAITLVRGLLKDPNRSMRIGCCTLSVFERQQGAPEDVALLGSDIWNILSLGDGTHLKEGAQRDWGFEDVQIKDGRVSNIALHSWMLACSHFHRSLMTLESLGQRTMSMNLLACNSKIWQRCE
jgi:transcription factor C subunit 7